MKARKTPAKAPESPRYWTHDLGEWGTLTLRMCSFAAGHKVRDLIAQHPIGEDGEAITSWLADHVPYAAAAVGLCWADERWELETPLPTDPRKMDADTLYAYGLAVADELQTAGWPMMAITNVGFSVTTELLRRTDILREAEALARFSPAQAADSSIS